MLGLTATWAIWSNGNTPKLGWNRVGSWSVEHKNLQMSETVQISETPDIFMPLGCERCNNLRVSSDARTSFRLLLRRRHGWGRLEQSWVGAATDWPHSWAGGRRDADAVTRHMAVQRHFPLSVHQHSWYGIPPVSRPRFPCHHHHQFICSTKYNKWQ